MSYLLAPQPGQLRVVKTSVRVYTRKRRGRSFRQLHTLEKGDPLFVVELGVDPLWVTVLTAKGVGECFSDTLLNHSYPAGT